MAIPENKTQLIAAIENNFSSLHAELMSIPKSLVMIKNMEGHSKNTSISVHNLVSYLIGWGNLIIKWNHKKDNNEEPDLPESGYKWNELGKLAHKFYADYSNYDYKKLLLELVKSKEQILELINAKSNRELYQTLWYRDYSLGRMIQLNSASPYQNARLRLRKWKKQNNLL